MGRIKIDTNKSDIKYDNLFPYTSDGLNRLLRKIHTLDTSEQYAGDVNAILIRVDLERALNSECLSPRERQSIAMYYFTCLTQHECALLLRIERKTIDLRLEKSLDKISRHMNGEDVTSSQTIWNKDYLNTSHDSINSWNENILKNNSEWWFIPDDVWAYVQSKFNKYKQDTQSSVNDVSCYPVLTEKQMEWKQYIETPRDEIHRTFDSYGYVSDGAGSKTKILNKERYT